MPKFAANIMTLFTEWDVPDRVLAAAEAGFDAVEIPFPYDAATIELRNALGRAGIPAVLINAPPPNYTGGSPGFAARPGGAQRFQHDFRRALRYAQALGVQHVHVMSGAAHGDEAFATLVSNLQWAVDFAPKQQLTLEPLNDEDLPGYFMNSYQRAADVIAAVGSPAVSIQFDTYHAQKITGDVLTAWEDWHGLVGHVQLAGLSDQGEPDAPDLDLPGFLRRLTDEGYDGWIGADYRPRGKTTAGLGWLAAAQEAAGTLRRKA